MLLGVSCETLTVDNDADMVHRQGGQMANTIVNSSNGTATGNEGRGHGLGLFALAAGAFVFGAAEFVMMGILPQVAQALRVSIPFAGNFISAYAIGVCVGTLLLIFGRRIPPRSLIILFMIIAFAGNALSAVAVNAPMMIAARFIAGVPHGAFFGTATLIAKLLARRGKEAQAVASMVTGQTVANMLGVPAGTLLAEHLSWHLAFVALAACAVVTGVLVRVWVPFVAAADDAGLAGQFAFLRKPGPWMVLVAVFVGNVGIFCWWSYVSPWLQRVGGWPNAMVSALMMLAGFGMVVGGLIGGRICDRWNPGATSALGQFVACVGLLAVFLIPGSRVSTAVLTFVISFGLFFVSAPQQLIMAECGGLIGGAAVQIAFNLGNAVGSMVGGGMLDASHMNYHYPALSGVPFAVLAVLLLVLYSARYERRGRDANLLRA